MLYSLQTQWGNSHSATWTLDKAERAYYADLRAWINFLSCWLLGCIHCHLHHQHFVFLKHSLCWAKHRYPIGLQISKYLLTFGFQTSCKLLKLKSFLGGGVEGSVAKRSSICFTTSKSWEGLHIKVGTMCHAMDTHYEGACLLVNGEFMGWLGFLPLFPHMIRWSSMLIRLMPKFINLIRWKT